jgi:hypothetical protein
VIEFIGKVDGATTIKKAFFLKDQLGAVMELVFA